MQFLARWRVRRGGHWRRITERLTFVDARAIEAACPSVRFVLPKNENYRVLVTSRDGSQARPILEGVTAYYAAGMHWNVQEGRFLTEADITEAYQVCVLGYNTATDLFGAVSPVGHEVKNCL